MSAGADELRIETFVGQSPVPAGATRPRVRFQVTDSNGRPVPAALSLAAVDEAVFYVCENQPGRLDQFFLADGELPLSGYQMAFADLPRRSFSVAKSSTRTWRRPCSPCTGRRQAAAERYRGSSVMIRTVLIYETLPQH